MSSESSPPSPPAGPLAALARWGGLLLRPRATVAALPHAAGRRDGALFLLLYAAGAHLLPIGDAVADFLALASLSALPVLLSGLAAVVPWLVATLGVEALLGPQRAHRAALCLLPMLLLVTAGRLLAGLGHPVPLPRYGLDILGALLAGGLALWLRPAIRLSEAPAPDRAPPARPPALLLGLLVLAVPLASAGRDAADLARHWRTIAPVAAGDALPDFVADDLGGAPFTTADLRGKAHLLVFFTSWCGVCQSEMPSYGALHRELSARGFAVVGVNCDREGDQAAIARRYAADHQLPFRVILDPGALARAFRLSVYPHLVLIDAHGQIRWVHQGRAFDRTIRGAVEDALAAAP